MSILKTLYHLIEASEKANNRNLQRAVDGFYLRLLIERCFNAVLTVQTATKDIA
jgi:hypothetical protein